VTAEIDMPWRHRECRQSGAVADRAWTFHALLGVAPGNRFPRENRVVPGAGTPQEIAPILRSAENFLRRFYDPLPWYNRPENRRLSGAEHEV
jgi:hypothetical protein